MAKSNSFETQLLQHLFNNAAISLVGDATGLPASATAGSLYIGLHTADPGEAGDQSTSEATYTGYARVAVARSSAGFTVSGNSVSNTAAISFGQCTAGSNSITHFSVGTSASGAGKLLYKGALNSSLAVSTGISPEFAAGQLTITEE